MKTKQLLAVMAAVVLGSGAAWAQTTHTNLTFLSGATIPDANNNGIGIQSPTLSLSTLNGPISSLKVSLDISGGFNGDLYATLAGPSGGFTVLLNRTGVQSGNTHGYSDAGFNVTFDDTLADGNGNIHFYQNAVNPGGGVLTGTWQPDGENIDPQSPAASFPTTPTAFLSSFDGTNPNGQWTLFLSDLSAGNQSTVVSWGLDITAVPEPGTLALAAIGGLAVLLLRNSRQRRF
jgi:subtilisin-like proprotein convertase family protein